MRDSNDVLAKLLTGWVKETEFNGTKVYLRVANDALVSDSRRTAVYHSSQLREKLRNSESEESKVFFYALRDITRDSMINAIIGSKVQEEVTKFETVTIKRIVESPNDTATPEQLEDYEKELEARDSEYIQARIDHLNEWEQKQLKKYEKYTDEKLLELCREALIDVECINKTNREMLDRIVAASVFRDASYKQRVFDSYEEFSAIPDKIKDFFIAEYLDLRVASNSIKNS